MFRGITIDDLKPNGFKIKELLDYKSGEYLKKRSKEEIEKDNEKRKRDRYIASQTSKKLINDGYNEFNDVRSSILPFTKEATYKLNIFQITEIIKNAYSNNYLSRMVKEVINELSNPNNAKLRYYNIPRFNEMEKIAKGGFGSVYQLGRENNFPVIIKDQNISLDENRLGKNSKITYVNFYQEVYNSLRINSLRDDNFTPNFYYFIDYHITPKDDSLTIIGENMKNIDKHIDISEKKTGVDYVIGSLIYEKIDGPTFYSIAHTLSEREFFSIFMQIVISLQVAKARLNFNHSDLHAGNVLIKPLDEEKQIQYNSPNKRKLYVKTKYIAYIIDYGFASVDNMINLATYGNHIDNESEGISRDLFYFLISIPHKNIKNMESYKLLMKYYLIDYENLPEDFDYRNHFLPKGLHNKYNIKDPKEEFLSLNAYIYFNLNDLHREIVNNQSFNNIPIANCNFDCYNNLARELRNNDIISNNLYYYWLINNNVILSNDSDNYAIIKDLEYYLDRILNNNNVYEVKYNEFELILMIIRQILTVKKNVLDINTFNEYQELYSRVLGSLYVLIEANKSTNYADKIFSINVNLIKNI